MAQQQFFYTRQRCCILVFYPWFLCSTHYSKMDRTLIRNWNCFTSPFLCMPHLWVIIAILTYGHSIFFWELLPEWMFPLLTGLSVFCLANQKSQDFTRVFGGSNGNEGLGLLSICFDWQYISGGYNPFAIPLQAQFSNLIGYILCM